LVVVACACTYALTTLVPHLPWKKATLLTPSAPAPTAAFDKASAQKASAQKASAQNDDRLRKVRFDQAAADALVEARGPGDQPVAAKPQEDEPEAPTDEERFTYAEGVFDSQTIDPAWSRDSSYKLSTAISTLDSAGVRVNPVQCRSSLCRVEIQAENRGAGERFVRNLIRSAKWGEAGGMVVRSETNPTGAYTIHVYLARSGTSPPEPPEAHPHVEEQAEP
jgi:hypothetical protein